MAINNYVWGFGNRIITLLATLLNTLILAKFLTPEDFGKVGMLAILVSLGTTIADTGMGGSLVKEKNLTKLDCSTVFVYNLVFSLLLYFIFFICAPSIEKFYNTPGLCEISRIVTLPIIISALTIVPRSLLYKQLEFKKIFLISLISSILSITTSVVLAINGAGVWALVSYTITYALLENICYHAVCRYVPHFAFSKESFKKLFSFGFFTTLSTIVDTVYENILSILLGKFVGATEVGYYTQAKRIEETPSKSVSTSVANVVFPMLCHINNNEIEFIKKAKEIQGYLLEISTVIMLLIALYADTIIILMFGPSWIEAAYYLRILCIAGVFIIIENTNRTFIKSLGRSDIMFKIAMVKRTIGLSIIALSLIWGIKYVLWGYVLSTIIASVINAHALSKLINYSLLSQIREYLRPLIVGSIVYVANIFFRNSVPEYTYIQIVFAFFSIITYFIMQRYSAIYIRKTKKRIFKA